LDATGTFTEINKSVYRIKRAETEKAAPAGGIRKLKIYSDYITEEWQKQGFSLEEPDDHILELRKGGQVIATFSQTGVRVENIVKEIQAGKYSN